MRADRHHPAPRCALFQQLVKIEFDLLKKLPRREIASLNKQNIVVAQRVGNNDEVLSVYFFNEGLIAADVVNVVRISEFLQKRQRIRADPL